MRYFLDKVIWITGASSGIGESLAYELCAQGARVILSARREAELHRVAGRCAALGGGEVRVVGLDLSGGLEALEKRAKEADAQFGRVDILVNNAGVSQRSLALDTAESVERGLFETNYFGTVALTKAVVRTMLLRGAGGQVVVISSVAGKVATALRSSYAASKHALQGYFDALRAELHGTGVSVTTICPGYVRTQISMNALLADGTTMNTMDRRTNMGLDPDVCARKIVRAIRKRKVEVLIGGKEKYAAYLRALFPALTAWFIARIKAT